MTIDSSYSPLMLPGDVHKPGKDTSPEDGNSCHTCWSRGGQVSCMWVNLEPETSALYEISASTIDGPVLSLNYFYIKTMVLIAYHNLSLDILCRKI